MEYETNDTTPRARRWVQPAALAAAGLLAGGILAGTLSANADSTTGSTGSTATSTAAPEAPGGNADQSQPQRSDEELLTGTTAAKVKAAVLAKYPNAVIVRIETDSDGVYEAHVTVDGQPVTVELDKSFAITGEESMGGRGQAPGTESSTTESST